MHNVATPLRTRSLALVLLWALAWGLLWGLAAPGTPAWAESQEPRILVSGLGTAQQAPDQAIMTLTVEREAKTARAALDANSQAMQAVLQAMRAQGLADKDLQTSGFSIQPRYVYPKSMPGQEPEAPRLVGYSVVNSLTVRVRDLERVGAVLDQAVSLGVNRDGHISFINSNPAEALAEARRRAMQDAIAKAKTLAEAAGVGLGKILEISEGGGSQPRPMAKVAVMAAMAPEADAVPIAAGENSFQVSVQVIFAIAQ